MIVYLINQPFISQFLKMIYMKKILPLLIFSLVSFSIYGQSTAGQIAHWDFNGSANDVSGNGHNGHLNNVVPAVGISGLPNSA